MLRLTDVVKNLIIINVLMYFGTVLVMGDPGFPTHYITGYDRGVLSLYYPGSDFFKPFQVVTHMFMHGGIAHLFFNMFVLYMFGPILETLWGAKRFLLFYFVAGFGAVIVDLLVKWIQISQFGEFGLVNASMWGASGAIYGVLVGFAMKFPNQQLMLLIPPIPMKAKYFILIFIGLDLFLGLTNAGTGIAHFAHLGGALFGALTVLYWNKFGSRV